MGLQGTFDTMKADQLFQWITLENRTGMLSVERSGIKKTVTLKDNGIVNVSSNEPKEYLGQFLINLGLVSEDHLQKAFETQQETRMMIGRILVMTRTVSEERLSSVLRYKISETVLDLFLWEQGQFDFQQGKVTEMPSFVPISVEMQSLYKKGLERKLAFQRIRRTIPQNNCVLACVEDQIPENLDPKSSDGVIIRMVRSGLSPADMLLRLHSTEYPLLHRLYRLLQRGWLVSSSSLGSGEREVLCPDAPHHTMEPEKILGNAQQEMKKGDYEKALTILRRGLECCPYDRNLCAALKLAEKRLSDELSASLLSEKRIPYLICGEQDQNTDLSPALRYILSRIDSKRTIESIIAVSPLKKVEALQAMRDLIRKGFVGFH